MIGVARNMLTAIICVMVFSLLFTGFYAGGLQARGCEKAVYVIYAQGDDAAGTHFCEMVCVGRHNRRMIVGFQGQC